MYYLHRTSGRAPLIVADPDVETRRQVSALLEQDFRMIGTASLAETYHAVIAEPPRLIILELDQPDGDGVEFIRYLQSDPTLRPILIACLTRRAAIRDKLAAFKAGADDYLVKPLMPSSNLLGRMLLLKQSGLIGRQIRD